MRRAVAVTVAGALVALTLLATAVPAAPGPRRGGEVVWGLEAETTGGWCLPQAQLAVSGIMVANSIYDPLVALGRTGEYVPYLAKSVTPDADHDEWTITLRDGVRFHDGTPLDAAAVKLNLDSYRGANPRINARLNVFVFGNVADVRVVDVRTLVVTTKTPWPAFPAVLYNGGRAGMVAPAQLNDPATCASNLIGTGPFRLAEWRVNDRLVVTRNPSYWRDGLPYLDRITFRPVADASARLNQFQGGALDVMHTTSVDNIVALREDAEAGRAQLFQSKQGGEVAYAMLNASRPPFDDILARRAFAYGRNTEKINQIRNRGIPRLATGPFGPGQMGHLKDAGLPAPNLKKARALVAEYEAKHGRALAFEYLTGPEPDTIAIAELIKEQAAKAGIEVSIRTADQSTLINEALAGSFQALGWRNHGFGDPDAQGVWWRSGSPVNFGRIKDPEIDRLLDAGRVELDPAARTRIYEDLNRRFAEQVWNLWSWYTVWVVAAKPDVRGVLGPALPDGGGKPAFASGFVPVVGEWRRAD